MDNTMKAEPTSKSKAKKKVASDQSVSPKVLGENDEDLRHQMLLTSAYYRAERRGFAAPELREKVIRGEAARRKRERRSDSDSSLIEAESEVDKMLKGTSEVERYLRSFEEQLTLWDGQFKSVIDELHGIRTGLESEYDRQLLSVAACREVIGNHLLELRGFTGEVWGELKDGIDQAFERMVQVTESIASGLRRDTIPPDKQQGESSK